MRTSRLVLLAAWLYCSATVAWAESGKILVLVQDAQKRPVRGVEIGVEGGGGANVTGDDGKALLALTKDTSENDWISLQIMHSPPGKDIAMLSPYDNRVLVPSFKNKAENFVRVVVIQRGDLGMLQNGTVMKEFAERINKATTIARSADKSPLPQEDPRAAVAKQFGIGADEVDKAIRAWGATTTDPYDVGLAALYERNYSKATADLQASLKQREEKLSSDQNAVLEAAFFLGQSLSGEGRHNDSVTAYERCLAIVQLSNNRPAEGLILLRLGQANNLVNTKESHEKAVRYFTQALPLFEGASASFNRANTLWGLGTAADLLGRIDQARNAYSEALSLFRELRDVRPEGRLLLRIGEIEDAAGNPRKAIEYYEQAAPILKSPGDELSEGLTLMKLGMSRDAIGEPARAIEAWRAAIPVWSAAKDRQSEATAHLKIGQIFLRNQDWEGSLAEDREALKLEESAGDRAGQAGALIAMFGGYMQLGDARNALGAALRSASLLDENSAFRPMVFGAAAKAYNALRANTDSPADSAKEPEIDQRTLGPDIPGMAASLNKLGLMQSAKGDKAEAEPLFRMALEIDNKLLGPNHPDSLAIRKNLDDLLRNSDAVIPPPKD